MGRAGDNDDQSEAQRRYVSVLFADVCDFTTLGEVADPEDIDRIKRRVEQLAAEVIRKRGGAISQVYGDGILAVFGMPSPHEDDARRAVDAAIELHEATRDARWDGELPPGFELRLHSGVHSGVVLGRKGDELHGRYSLTGDAVNTASRLCNAAGRDEVVVSAAALRGFEAYFLTQEVSPLSLRGKRLPVAASLVLGRARPSPGLPARTLRGLSAFSGRAHELEQVEQCWQQVRAGESRFVLISGDPGIGKSRLLEQLRQRALASGMEALSGYCDSYGEMEPLEPFLQVLRAGLGLEPGASPERITAEVEHLARAGEPLHAHRETLLQLLCLLPWPEAANDVQVLLRSVVAALAELLRTLSRARPLLLSLDDWQWADDASRQVLSAIVQDLEQQPVCIVLAMRAGSERHMLPQPSLELRLVPFTVDESRPVVHGLRPTDFDTGLIAALHVRSGGNPLFLEELCRALPDRPLELTRALESGAVPHTLHGVIQARVEALPADQLGVLRAAAVIGIEFTPALLSAVLGQRALEPQLEPLIAQDLIYRAQSAGGAFRFKHGITRDVIYESVRIAQRRRIHALIADAIEQSTATINDQAELLAYHHRQAGHHEHAALYAEQAGDKAMATSSLDRARFHYGAALNALDRLQPDDHVRARWLAICDKWANPSSYSPTTDQLATMERALRYARELQAPRAEAGASYFLGWFHYVFGNYGECIRAYEHARALALSIGDEKLGVQLCLTLAQAHAAAGNYRFALPLYEDGIARRRARHPTLPYRAWNLAHALGTKAVMHGDRGELAQSERDFAEAFTLVGGTGHAMEASLFSQHAMSRARQGLWHECQELAQRARETATRTNSSYVLAMSEALGGYARFMLTGERATLADMTRAIDWLQAHHHGLYLSVVHGCAADAQLRAGELAAARDYAERALERAKSGDPLGEASARRALAGIAAQSRAPHAEIAAHLEAALASGDRRDSPRERALTCLSIAELGVSLAGEPARERAASYALSTFEAIGMPWYAQRARDWLAAH